MQVDEILQLQLQHLCDRGREALTARVALVVCSGDDDKSGEQTSALAISGDPKDPRLRSRKHLIVEALGLLIHTTNSLLIAETNGKMHLAIGGKDGYQGVKTRDVTVEIREVAG